MWPRAKPIRPDDNGNPFPVMAARRNARTPLVLLAERGDVVGERIRSFSEEDADERHRRLLRAGRERPRGRRAAAKQDDEIAPSHEGSPS